MLITFSKIFIKCAFALPSRHPWGDDGGSGDGSDFQ